MLASFLMALVGGQRGMTPLAAVSVAAARGDLPADHGGPPFLGHPLVVGGSMALAAAELAGDKMKSAPDRIVPVGLATRFVACAIAGAALAPRRQRWGAAALAGATAVAASYPGWHGRIATMRRHGRKRTGLVEDVMVVAGAVAILCNLDRLAAR
ncbi:DUF4126 domain-containing protein [Falsiroseomonas selenitidurans]|uniref:DUF4126 domain-containing protein n=1 Tax=Falsiroseomonas selenitidurans TaxID=2716335 RepID=A0ABX1DXV7_9PROT|nr:DUF4126 domain-containing protein [Falsiroseomonas selenitidurans]NKC29706.1 DUF4126 domain-containing protein [Falsiroseomonas selenitidurans]